MQEVWSRGLLARGHLVFLCMLIDWHLCEALAPLLFRDTDIATA